MHTRYSKHYRPIDRFQDSGKDLVDQAHGETVKRDLQRRGLAWEEVEAAVLGRQDLRQSVAQCVHTDAGWMKVTGRELMNSTDVGLYITGSASLSSESDNSFMQLMLLFIGTLTQLGER